MPPCEPCHELRHGFNHILRRFHISTGMTTVDLWYYVLNEKSNICIYCKFVNENCFHANAA